MLVLLRDLPEEGLALEGLGFRYGSEKKLLLLKDEEEEEKEGALTEEGI